MTTSFARLLSSAANSALCSTRSQHLTRSVSNSVTRLLCSSSTQQHRDNPVREQPQAQGESLSNDESKRIREEDEEEGDEDRDVINKETGEVGGPKGPEPTRSFRVVADGFPSFLPREVERIKDPLARKLAMRIQRLPVPVRFSENPIMSSCVMPLVQSKEPPIVLLHGFDSSCLEWRYGYPLLEESGFETWAIDILGWGFCDLEKLPPCDVVSKREHFYQFWKSYIRRPMILVGPSLGSAVAIDFAVNYPEAVENLVLIDASVYAEGTGNLATLPRAVAYAGVYLLKSIPLRLYATYLTFTSMSFRNSLDWTDVGRLHCLLPWWDDATVDFMTSGGYNIASLIRKVKQKTLIIWGENDRIISNKFAVQLHCELPNAVIRQIPDCGHIPHLERPDSTIKLIVEFVQRETKKLNQCASQV